MDEGQDFVTLVDEAHKIADDVGASRRRDRATVAWIVEHPAPASSLQNGVAAVARRIIAPHEELIARRTRDLGCPD